MPSNLKIEKAATEFRERHGYNSSTPIRIKSLLIELKILTVFKNMEGSFSGMSLKIEDSKFMLINSAHSIGRQHFTIMHELYHLFVQKDFEHVICEDDENGNHKKEEELADIFAANLLIPKDGILKRVNSSELGKKDKISINSILELEQYFSCSHKSMLKRLEQLGFISNEYKDRLSSDIIKLAQEYGYETSLYSPGNEGLIIGDYGAKAKRLFDSDVISQTHYIELMRDLGIDLEEDKSGQNES